MILRAACITAVLTLTGCAAKVVSSTPRTVMVDAPQARPGEALQAAEAECSKHGRHARLNSGPDGRRWTFDCVS
jgi:hypothetical protein